MTEAAPERVPEEGRSAGAGLADRPDSPYLIPGTDCLDNLLDITDPDVLAQAEADISLIRVFELTAWRALPGNYDLQHLQDFHAVIFGDVYPWAGETRIVDIAKGGTIFTHHGDLPELAGRVFQMLADRGHLQGLDHKPDFVAGLADFYTSLNQLHPFREGNGRTQRAFWTQLAAGAGWEIDWTEVVRRDLLAAGRTQTLSAGVRLATTMLAPSITPIAAHPLHAVANPAARAARLRSTTGRAPRSASGAQRAHQTVVRRPERPQEQAPHRSR